MGKKMQGHNRGVVPPEGSIVAVDMPDSERPAYGHVAHRSDDRKTADVQLTPSSRDRHGLSQGLQTDVDKSRIREM